MIFHVKLVHTSTSSQVTAGVGEGVGKLLASSLPDGIITDVGPREIYAVLTLEHSI